MIIELLLLAFGFHMPLQQTTDQELRRQQQQLDQIHSQLEQLGRITELLELAQRGPKSANCTAQLNWVTGGQDVRVPASPSAVVRLNLFSTVSEPSAGCLPAEIRLAASYLDATESLICTGIVEDIAVQDRSTQSVNLDVRPWNIQEFVRWRNEPPAVNSGARRLPCLNPEGTAEATNEELAKVASVHVRVTVLPAGGGIAGVEIGFKLR
jgi:hypothetical protein